MRMTHCESYTLIATSTLTLASNSRRSAALIGASMSSIRSMEMSWGFTPTAAASASLNLSCLSCTKWDALMGRTKEIFTTWPDAVACRCFTPRIREGQGGRKGGRRERGERMNEGHWHCTHADAHPNHYENAELQKHSSMQMHTPTTCPHLDRVGL